MIHVHLYIDNKQGCGTSNLLLLWDLWKSFGSSLLGQQDNFLELTNLYSPWMMISMSKWPMEEKEFLILIQDYIWKCFYISGVHVCVCVVWGCMCCVYVKQGRNGWFQTSNVGVLKTITITKIHIVEDMSRGYGGPPGRTSSSKSKNNLRNKIKNYRIPVSLDCCRIRLKTNQQICIFYGSKCWEVPDQVLTFLASGKGPFPGSYTASLLLLLCIFAPSPYMRPVISSWRLGLW